MLYPATELRATARMAAGIDAARAGADSMDADLQNDPADMSACWKRLDEGYDVFPAGAKSPDKLVTRKFLQWLPIVLISWIGGCPARLRRSLKAYRRESLQDVQLYGRDASFISILRVMVGDTVTEIRWRSCAHDGPNQSTACRHDETVSST